MSGIHCSLQRTCAILPFGTGWSADAPRARARRARCGSCRSTDARGQRACTPLPRTAAHLQLRGVGEVARHDALANDVGRFLSSPVRRVCRWMVASAARRGAVAHARTWHTTTGMLKRSSSRRSCRRISEARFSALKFTKCSRHHSGSCAGGGRAHVSRQERTMAASGHRDEGGTHLAREQEVVEHVQVRHVVALHHCAPRRVSQRSASGGCMPAPPANFLRDISACERDVIWLRGMMKICKRACACVSERRLSCWWASAQHLLHGEAGRYAQHVLGALVLATAVARH
jgi:hypothetical protein